MLRTPLIAIGLAVVLLVAFEAVLRLGVFLQAHFVQRRHDLLARYAAAGQPSASFAVVTCARADGIGVALAAEFLQAGFNVAVLAQHEDVLQAAFGYLRAVLPPHGLDLKVVSVQADLGDLSSNTLAKLRETLTPLDIAVLIHDAGVGTFAMPFSDVGLEDNRRSLNLNAISPVLLTQALEPELRGRVTSGQASRSALIYVGAGVASQATRGLAVYSAAKALEASFCEALSEESPSTLDVLCLRPLAAVPSSRSASGGGKKNSYHSMGAASWYSSHLTPEEIAEAAMRQLGHASSRPWTAGHWQHELQWAVLAWSPRSLYQSLLLALTPKDPIHILDAQDELPSAAAAAAAGAKEAPAASGTSAEL
eukprot:TRINITY_DN48047_c0_g1_i2.p1 TRINITY_DN48047_c0_g1~~TRINITY_DN48047_c0_g1_i2.p1  ORF type:complete len:366 (-),score=82.96 TRINITY_DN48047_c0_g1_i2:84-1181(-)